MKTHQAYLRITGLALLAAILLSSGCATRQPPQPEPLSGHELQVFLSKSKYPDLLGIEMIDRADGVFFRNANEIKGARRTITDFAPPRASVLPVIEVDGKKGSARKMLLDTSSRKSWISQELLNDFDFVPLGPSPHRFMATHVRDSIAGVLVAAPLLKVNKTLISSAIMYMRADQAGLWPVSRSFKNPAVEAVMGCGMMKAFAFIRIDYPRRIVMFSAENVYPRDESTLLAAAPIVWEDGAIAVDAVIDGEKERLLIDSGGDYELVRPDGDTNACSQIFIDDLVVLNPEVADSRPLGVDIRSFPSIGSRLLSRYAIVIDMARQEIIFERP